MQNIGLAAVLFLFTNSLSYLFAQDAVADSDGIFWAEKSRDALLCGVKLTPVDRRVKVGEKVTIQYVLKNESKRAKTITCDPVSIPVFLVNSQNHLNDAWSTSRGAKNRIAITAGEAFESENYQFSFSTAGMIPGEYTLWSLSGFYVPDSDYDKTFRSTGIGSVNRIRFHVEPAGDPVAIKAPEEGTGIYWGDSVCGIQLGAKRVRVDAQGELVEKSARYHTEDYFELQLFAFNGRETPVEIEISSPGEGNNWPLKVTFEDGKPCKLEHRKDTNIAGPKLRLTIEPGKSQPFSGVPVTTLVLKRSKNLEEQLEATTENAGFEIIPKESSSDQIDESYRLRAELGNYEVTTSIQIKLLSNEMLLDTKSGVVPFRIEKHPRELKEKE